MGGFGEYGICKIYKELTEHHAKELGKDLTGKFPVIMICNDCHVFIEKYMNLLRDRHDYNPDKK